MFFLVAIAILVIGVSIHWSMNNPEIYSGFRISIGGTEVASGYAAWWCIVLVSVGVCGTVLLVIRSFLP